MFYFTFSRIFTNKNYCIFRFSCCYKFRCFCYLRINYSNSSFFKSRFACLLNSVNFGILPFSLFKCWVFSNFYFKWNCFCFLVLAVSFGTNSNFSLNRFFCTSCFTTVFFSSLTICDCSCDLSFLFSKFTLLVFYNFTWFKARVNCNFCFKWNWVLVNIFNCSSKVSITYFDNFFYWCFYLFWFRSICYF